MSLVYQAIIITFIRPLTYYVKYEGQQWTDWADNLDVVFVNRRHSNIFHIIVLAVNLKNSLSLYH